MHRLARAHLRRRSIRARCRNGATSPVIPMRTQNGADRCSHALCGGGRRLGPHRRLSMKIALPTLIAAVAVAGVAFTTPADTMERYMPISPHDINWGRAAAAFPRAAEAVVMLGDPSKKGLF